MVVQSVALPKVSGSSRDHELVLVPADAVVVAPVAARSAYASALFPLLIATQAAWLALLGYVAYRILL
jgi:hypothetical protein